MKVLRFCKMTHRLKFYFLLFAAACMILLDHTVFSTWREVKAEELAKYRKLKKEQQIKDVHRISANFASFQKKFNQDNEGNFGGTVQENLNVAALNTGHVAFEVSLDSKGNAIKKDENVYADNNYHNYFKFNNKLDHELVNKHNYEFSLNNEYACNGNVLVVILIHSDPKKENERKAIRDTWGSINFHSGATIVTMFLLAETLDEKLQEKITVESDKYVDIVQGNFIDSYRNLTAKCVMGLHWVEKYCNHTKFVLKVDDDTMVDVYHLVDFLIRKSPDGNMDNFLYCSTFRNQGPVRRTSDKWFVTKEEYSFEKYPPYCEGFAYLMSHDVAKKLYDATRYVQFYWIDDVYLTGLVALKADIPPQHRDMEQGHAYNLMEEEHLSKNVKSSIFLLAKYSQHRHNWDKAWKDIKGIHELK